MEDMEIIGMYWERTQEAVTATADRYGLRLHRLALGILGSRQDAEECVSDTYLAAWNSIPPQRPVHLFAYLAKIDRNLALGKLAYYRADKRDRELTQLLDELDQCAAPDREPGEITELLNEFLAGLKPEQRVVFVRRYWYAEPVAALAEQLQMSQSKVKSMLFRLRKQLKTKLEQEGVTE